MWDIRSVLNILYSLVSRSAINEQLVVFQQGGDPATVAGAFGKCSLYKNLGYFSLIALLRLHCQLGDYYLAMEAVRNVQLSKKVREGRKGRGKGRGRVMGPLVVERRKELINGWNEMVEGGCWEGGGREISLKVDWRGARLRLHEIGGKQGCKIF